jgi:hypothetical protein
MTHLVHHPTRSNQHGCERCKMSTMHVCFASSGSTLAAAGHPVTTGTPGALLAISLPAATDAPQMPSLDHLHSSPCTQRLILTLKMQNRHCTCPSRVFCTCIDTFCSLGSPCALHSHLHPSTYTQRLLQTPKLQTSTLRARLASSASALADSLRPVPQAPSWLPPSHLTHLPSCSDLHGRRGCERSTAHARLTSLVSILVDYILLASQ